MSALQRGSCRHPHTVSRWVRKLSVIQISCWQSYRYQSDRTWQAALAVSTDTPPSILCGQHAHAKAADWSQTKAHSDQQQYHFTDTQTTAKSLKVTEANQQRGTGSVRTRLPIIPPCIQLPSHPCSPHDAAASFLLCTAPPLSLTSTHVLLSALSSPLSAILSLFLSPLCYCEYKLSVGPEADITQLPCCFHLRCTHTCTHTWVAITLYKLGSRIIAIPISAIILYNPTAEFFSRLLHLMLTQVMSLLGAILSDFVQLSEATNGFIEFSLHTKQHCPEAVKQTLKSEMRISALLLSASN